MTLNANSLKNKCIKLPATAVIVGIRKMISDKTELWLGSMFSGGSALCN